MPCADHNINVCMSVCGGEGAVYKQLSMLGSWATSFDCKQWTSGDYKTEQEEDGAEVSQLIQWEEWSQNGPPGWDQLATHTSRQQGWGSLHAFGPSWVCLDETTRGTQSCTSRLVYKEALSCSLPNKHYQSKDSSYIPSNAEQSVYT